MNPILNKYPYFVVPAIEELQNASGEERVALVRRIAAAVGDPTALRTIIGVDPEEFLSFYPDMKTPELSTDDTIDSFIDRFGNPNTPKPTEVEDIITPVAVPYDLSSLEDLPELTNADLFPADLAPGIPQNPAPSATSHTSSSPATIPATTPAHPDPIEHNHFSDPIQTEEPEPVQPEEPDSDANSSPSHASAGREPSLSESLARIMIKNGNYQKALEIITEISLNNPKKSIYFADQIRFLKKLIALQSR